MVHYEGFHSILLKNRPHIGFTLSLWEFQFCKNVSWCKKIALDLFSLMSWLPFHYQHMFLWHLFVLWNNFTIYFVQDNLVRPVCGNLGFTSPCFAQL